MLRNSLFVSSVLYNSEVWYNLTKAELNLLETIDVDLLRGILKASKSTPKQNVVPGIGYPSPQGDNKKKKTWVSSLYSPTKKWLYYKKSIWNTKEISDIERLGHYGKKWPDRNKYEDDLLKNWTNEEKWIYEYYQKKDRT